jgi:hypothetical protein
VGTIGIGIAIFLFVFMQGIILSGNVTPNSAQILSRLWIAGVIPLFVGISLIINGLFVSKKLVEIAEKTSETGPKNLERELDGQSLRPADTTEFIPSSFSVTEQTTRHLRSSGEKQ